MDTIKDIVIFQKDSFLAFVFKKTQAVLNALYLVTNLFPDQEPLKLAIRQKGLSLFDKALSLPGKSVTEQKKIFTDAISKAIEITALSQTAESINLISQMNFGILKSELENLVKAIQNQENQTLVTLDVKSFEVAHTINFKDNQPAPLVSDIQRTSSKTPTGTIGKASDKNSFALARNFDERQKAILGVLKGKADMSIKEILGTMPNLSEKTLQRELQRLTAKGLLKKEGSRRWSRYSVI